jgi:hypothetical protein
MDEETLRRAMEPFFTTKGLGKGTGLGLSMVHGFAEQSGGRFILHSRKGTTAELWLPVAAMPAPKIGPADKRKAVPAKGTRPLVVLAGTPAASSNSGRPNRAHRLNYHTDGLN